MRALRLGLVHDIDGVAVYNAYHPAREFSVLGRCEGGKEKARNYEKVGTAVEIAGHGSLR